LKLDDEFIGACGVNRLVEGESSLGTNFGFFFFHVLLTVHLSIFILVINQLDAQIFLLYNKFISCLHMFRAHVLETCGSMK